MKECSIELDWSETEDYLKNKNKSNGLPIEWKNEKLRTPIQTWSNRRREKLTKWRTRFFSESSTGFPRFLYACASLMRVGYCCYSIDIRIWLSGLGLGFSQIWIYFPLVYLWQFIHTLSQAHMLYTVEMRYGASS